MNAPLFLQTDAFRFPGSGARVEGAAVPPSLGVLMDLIISKKFRFRKNNYCRSIKAVGSAVSG
jgi:hypothetical protein